LLSFYPNKASPTGCRLPVGLARLSVYSYCVHFYGKFIFICFLPKYFGNFVVVSKSVQNIVMKNDLKCRDANNNDIEALKHLGLISYGAYAPFLTPDNLEKLKNNVGSSQTWTDILKVAKSFVCVDGEKIIGMAFFIPSGNPWDIFQKEWSYIRMVGVDPEYQGKGIAKSLTKMCINHAKTTNEKIVALHTSEIMYAARHIYENLGFKVLHEIEKRLGLRYWLYTLELK
jgi:ribosomal protein S18 acetylase RimI-like enzyme